MMALFFDATYFGKLHWREPGFAEVLACAATTDELVCSMHGRAEFYSIGFRKVREGLVAPLSIQAIFAQFNADIATGPATNEIVMHRIDLKVIINPFMSQFV